MKAIDYWAVHRGRPINDTPRDNFRPLSTNPTLDECRRHGRSHKSYGWTPSTSAHWSYDQVNAYCEAYDQFEERSQ